MAFRKNQIYTVYVKDRTTDETIVTHLKRKSALNALTCVLNELQYRIDDGDLFEFTVISGFWEVFP